MGTARLWYQLARITDDENWLSWLDRSANALTRSGGLRWVQAEHRVNPTLLVAQTGYMQGAAGIGMWLLRLDAAENGRKDFVRFPDTPF